MIGAAENRKHCIRDTTMLRLLLIGPHAASVYLALLAVSQGDGVEISLGTLSFVSCVSRSQILRILPRLEAARLIAIERCNRADGGNGTNRYRILGVKDGTHHKQATV